MNQTIQIEFNNCTSRTADVVEDHLLDMLFKKTFESKMGDRIIQIYSR